MTSIHELNEDCLIDAGAVVIKNVPQKGCSCRCASEDVRVKE